MILERELPFILWQSSVSRSIPAVRENAIVQLYSLVVCTDTHVQEKYREKCHSFLSIIDWINVHQLKAQSDIFFLFGNRRPEMNRIQWGDVEIG